MKKHRMILGVWLSIVLLCTGCGSNHTIPTQPNSTAADTPFLYSNLIDTDTQKQVTDLLENHGVSKEQTDTLISWANDFNSRITSGTLPKGFQPMGTSGADYSGLIIKNNEAEDGFIYPEANCRLTSYLLMKDLIKTNGNHVENDTILMFDVEAIDTYAPFALTKEERDQFISLFSWIPLDGADTLDAHISRIQDAWEDRNIQINGDGISLITVYLHSPFDQTRFVGHTGVLLETADGLLFLEKYGPQFPFQATKFHNREELKQYLLARRDLYGDETELSPLIFENNQLMA